MISLFILPLISVAIMLFNKFVLKNYFSNFQLFFINFIIIYAYILGTSIFYEQYYEMKLLEFDLNGDGSFSGKEITPEQQEAFNRVINDTARTFAPYTGFIFSAIYSAIIYLIVTVYQRKK